MAALIVGGLGSRLSAADVFAASCGRVRVALDSAARARLDRASSRSTESGEQVATEPNIPLGLNALELRASVLIVLWRACSGNLDLSAKDADHLVSIINARDDLIMDLTKEVDRVGLSQAILPAARQVIDPGALSTVCTAISAVTLYQGKCLLRLADAIAATSAEAMRASIHVSHTEISGVPTSDFTSYIEGSKRIQSVRRPSAAYSTQGIASVVQVHSAMKDAMYCLERALKGELAEASDNATGLACACVALEAAVQAATSCSFSRMSVMGNTCPKEVQLSSIHLLSNPLVVIRNASNAVKGLASALAREGVMAYEALLADARAAEETEAARVKEGKKSKKKKGQGTELGRGTSLFFNFLEGRVAHAKLEGLDLSKKTTESSSEPNSYEIFLEATDTKMLQELDAIQRILESNQGRRKPKIPKGTRDFLPEQMAIRERAFSKIVSVFKRHGAVCIDTPVFELRETLMGKYGEDSKLIYDLADQGGEILSLRYDLTVPFARYVALHNAGNIKRYHIARVYRRDNPAMNRGRFREFFQCDFDVAGSYAPMVPDAEVLKVITEILTDLEIGEFVVKLNHRKLLDACMEISGVPAQKFRTICSAIDKLDKLSWQEVRAEMTEQKGLPEEVADRVGEFVRLQGKPYELLHQLEDAGSLFAGHQASSDTLKELRLLFGYLEAMDALKHIHFDLSLARGLDYYTGVIYEAVFCGDSQVGSIAAGGRYDNLVGMFSGKDVPAVGVSLGIERVFAIKEEQERKRAAEGGLKVRSNETEVFVASIGGGMLAERMKIASELWAAGIKAEYGFKPNPKMGDQLNFCLENYIPYMVLIGETELQNQVVKIKNLSEREENTVPREEMARTLRRLLGKENSESLEVMCA